MTAAEFFHELAEFFRAAVPVFLALALPITLFVCRLVVRSQRTAAYDDLIHVLYPEGGQEMPQLELVRAKYMDRRRRPRSPDEKPLVDTYKGFLVMVVATWLYAAFSYIGFQLLLTPKTCLFGGGCDAATVWLQDSLAWSAVAPPGGQVDVYLVQTVSIAAVGFVGAYVATTQFLIRQLLNYELGPISFLRAAFQLFLGLAVPLVAFRIGSLIYVPWAGERLDPFPTWLGVAFFLGMAPQAGISWLSSRLKLTLEKRVNLQSLESAKIIPLEVIDGIDSTTRFRLDEADVHDVQNLATRNPIELYIETPYSVLQVFDWVLQAQLCLVVGPEAFQRLRQHRIRTIFDLERAVLADGAPEAYVQAVGRVIFSDAEPQFLEKLGGAEGLSDPAVIRHAVAVMCDDLHVHRLRALWKLILIRSGDPDQQAWLYRTGALPGDGDFAPRAVPTANGARPARRRKPPARGAILVGGLPAPANERGASG